MPKITTSVISKLEHERLFGEGVDLFKSYHASMSICNILKNLGLRNSKDTDFHRAVVEFVTHEELAEIYDRIIPRDRRAAMSDNSSRYRSFPPELDEEDPDDVLLFLCKKLQTRRKTWRMLHEVYKNRLTQFKEALANTDRTPSAVELRFKEMQELFELSDMEVRALAVIFLSATSFFDLGDYDICRFRHGEKLTALAQSMGVTDIEAAEMLSDENNLKKFGLVDDDLDLDRTFLSYLSGISNKPLAERFWVKYEGEVLPWNFHGKLAEKHGTVLKEMIAAKPENSGISCLLFGTPGSGKTSFCASLAADMNKTLYFIAQNDNDNRRMNYSPAFRYAALAVAQKQLDPAKSVLCIDECDKLVENSSLGGGLLAMFGIAPGGSRDGESKGQLNSVIDKNRHTLLWICNSKADAIDPSSRRRFDYNILFDELSADARKHIWNNALQFYKCENRLSSEFIDRISRRYAVNPGGISLAVKNAAMVCNANADKDFEKEVMVFLKAHCQLLGIAESPENKLEPTRDYSLEGLNIKSGIKLPRLIEVCKNYLASMQDVTLRDTPRCNIIIFGVPGSGKTEFVKYLAKALDMKLNIKNASDLLSCYHGMTEQRITQAFAEAEANKEILFIDEGDSMLSTRENAVRNFEVSQVNTLLSEMEKFRGIFIVGTNMVQRIDPAALRRFSFRLHLDFLTDEGKEIFFRKYFTGPMNLPELTEKECKELHAIDSLTPSDFRNTRQQFFYLQDSDLTNAEIITALATEVASKNSGSNYKGLGQIVGKLGF